MGRSDDIDMRPVRGRSRYSALKGCCCVGRLQYDVLPIDARYAVGERPLHSLDSTCRASHAAFALTFMIGRSTGGLFHI
jgi:hypothetical protein